MANQPGGQHFGGRLRAARERRGISLRQIASATKISVAVLEALERNDFSRLPGGIFSRAFIRSYAAEVGLDPERTIEEFLDELPEESPAVGHHAADALEDNAAIESDREAASTVLRLVLISVPVAALVIYAGLRGLRPSNPAAPLPPPSQLAEPVTPPPVVATAAEIPASPREPSPVAGPPAVPAGDLVPADRLTLTLEAARPCWLSIIVDGERSRPGMLQPGDRRTIEASREVVLTAGDAAALTLTLNGVNARPLGRSGEVVTARLTPSNFKEFLVNR